MACWVQKACLYRAYAAHFAGVASWCACGQPCHALCLESTANVHTLCHSNLCCCLLLEQLTSTNTPVLLGAAQTNQPANRQAVLSSMRALCYPVWVNTRFFCVAIETLAAKAMLQTRSCSRQKWRELRMLRTWPCFYDNDNGLKQTPVPWTPNAEQYTSNARTINTNVRTTGVAMCTKRPYNARGNPCSMPQERGCTNQCGENTNTHITAHKGGAELAVEFNTPKY